MMTTTFPALTAALAERFAVTAQYVTATLVRFDAPAWTDAAVAATGPVVQFPDTVTTDEVLRAAEVLAADPDLRDAQAAAQHDATVSVQSLSIDLIVEHCGFGTVYDLTAGADVAAVLAGLGITADRVTPAQADVVKAAARAIQEVRERG